MNKLLNIFKNNREWSNSVRAQDPLFFEKLIDQQNPEYLWIGCSDSRVPANQIVNLLPGELFVHRNVANVVVYTDLNCLSVIQYAVDVLNIKHIIVCGHYGCGGVEAAFRNERHGLVDNWFMHIRDIQEKHKNLINKGVNKQNQINLLCELNVIEQAINVCQTTVVQDAWERGKTLTVHGWIYGLHDGLLNDLGICVSDKSEINDAHSIAVNSSYETFLNREE
jgi:carbonic anhydrase